jgi:hypothetical protein
MSPARAHAQKPALCAPVSDWRARSACVRIYMIRSTPCHVHPSSGMLTKCRVLDAFVRDRLPRRGYGHHNSGSDCYGRTAVSGGGGGLPSRSLFRPERTESIQVNFLRHTFKSREPFCETNSNQINRSGKRAFTGFERPNARNLSNNEVPTSNAKRGTAQS